MRIALVSEHASPLAAVGGVDAGGQNVHVAELAAGLVRLGHQVTVHTRRDAADLPDRVVTAAGYEVVHVPAGPAAVLAKDDLWPYLPEFADRLTDLLAAERPDVVHAHFWMSAWAAERAAAALDVPWLVTFHALGSVKRRHQGAADPSPAERIEVERTLAVAADRVVATCSDEVLELRRMGLPSGRAAVVPCGVDATLFTPAGAVAPPPAPPLQHRVVTVGRLVPRKGFGVAIEALAGLPATELVIVGGASDDDSSEAEQTRLRELAAGCGLADRVRFAGQLTRTQMPALLRSADVVVCAPWYEPFGLVPLEAMACGVPVVASAVGGMLDSVADGVTGTLVPPEDAAALRSAVQALLADADRRQDCGRSGRRRVLARYTWARVAGATAEVYEQALRDRVPEVVRRSRRG